jgi:hypothetical protein
LYARVFKSMIEHLESGVSVNWKQIDSK